MEEIFEYDVKFSEGVKRNIKNEWRNALIEACSDLRSFSEIGTKALHKHWNGRMNALSL